MTQFIPMRTTDPPSPAPKIVARGRLCQSQNIALRTQNPLAKERESGPAVKQSMVAMTRLNGLLEHFAVTRAVKSP